MPAEPQPAQRRHAGTHKCEGAPHEAGPFDKYLFAHRIIAATEIAEAVAPLSVALVEREDADPEQGQPESCMQQPENSPERHVATKPSTLGGCARPSLKSLSRASNRRACHAIRYDPVHGLDLGSPRPPCHHAA